MYSFIFLTALALVLITGTAKAESFSSLGFGGASCGAWTSARRDRQEINYEQWVFGFLSGVGYEGVNLDPLNGMDAKGVDAWVDDYCLAHPIDRILIAAEAFRHAHPR